MNFFKKCAIPAGKTIDLNDIDPGETFGWSKADAKKQTEKNLAQIEKLQDMLYAEKKHALLMIIQAMDTGGKDGTVKTVGGAMNPAGLRVVSFKQPTKEELAKGFMWRIEKNAPAKGGEAVIYNRSQYEDVGVVRVHNIVPESEWRQRYDVINDWEHRISQPTAEIPGGTHVLKFFLHISKDEQWQRLMDRVNEPDKHWKIAESDFKERAYWKEYMAAYSEAISRCSTAEAPWFVIPADKKWMRDLIISQVVVDYLEGLHMKYPEPDVSIDEIKKKYIASDGSELKRNFNAAGEAHVEDDKPGKSKPRLKAPEP
jgi:PPK2 family polyphosphate:nucleotide phosphotransferase